jgi:hypothetical protein
VVGAREVVAPGVVVVVTDVVEVIVPSGVYPPDDGRPLFLACSASHDVVLHDAIHTSGAPDVVTFPKIARDESNITARYNVPVASWVTTWFAAVEYTLGPVSVWIR